MGTWDSTSFGNDTACDWSYGLAEVNDLTYVEAALDRVLDGGAGTLLAADVAECAVAASEVVARLRGNWGDESPYTESADQWVRSHSTRPPAPLVAKAVAALDRVVTGPSELLDLWAESGGEVQWTGAVSELRERVQR
ncbi:MAG TPA: DUF4259 domain-containing protein [Gemmatimonadales bacterium]|nr:DUF4259 domain-containing protein [Gemmatimonadales bacterium]